MDLRKLGIYSFAHMLVDFSCAFLMFFTLRSTDYFAVFVLIYNFCAFAMQMPLGILADRWNHNGIVAALGCGIIAVAYFMTAPVCISIAAGLGNALFHLGGGIDTMNASVKKATALGIFVSPGAFGLYVGTLLGNRDNMASLLWVVPIVLLFIGILILTICRVADRGFLTTNERFSLEMPIKPFWIMPLFIVVVLRSYMGMNQQFSWKGTWHWEWILIFALVFGKIAGGILMDCVGAKKAVFYTLLLSGIFYLFSSSLPLSGVLAVFLFNMTMPITLWYMGRLLTGAKGFAFGILTFGLFLGYVPAAFGILALPGYGWAYTSIAYLSLLMMIWSVRKVSC